MPPCRIPPTHHLLELAVVSPAPGKFQHSQKGLRSRGGQGSQVSPRSPPAQGVLQLSHQNLHSQWVEVTRAGAAQMELPEARCSTAPAGEGYTGHHLGTVKDRIQQGSPSPPSPSKPAQKCSDRTESTRQLELATAARGRLEDPCACSGARSPWWWLLFWFRSSPSKGFSNKELFLLIGKSCVMPLKGC